MFLPRVLRFSSRHCAAVGGAGRKLDTSELFPPEGGVDEFRELDRWAASTDSGREPMGTLGFLTGTRIPARLRLHECAFDIGLLTPSEQQ